MTDTPPKTPQTGKTSTTPGTTTPTTAPPGTATSTTGVPEAATSTTDPLSAGSSGSMGSGASTGTSGSTGSGADRLKHTAEDAKDAFSRTAQEGSERLQSGAQQVRDRAFSTSENAKNDAADEIGRTADALGTAAGEVEEGSVQQQLLREAADGLTKISGAMKGKNVGDIVADISQFGREHPAAFLGGAALAGFALARFARASETSRGMGTSSSSKSASGVGASGMGREPYSGAGGYQPGTDYRRDTETPGTSSTYPTSDFGGVKP